MLPVLLGRFYNSLSLKYSCGLNDVWVLNLGTRPSCSLAEIAAGGRMALTQ